MGRSQSYGVSFANNLNIIRSTISGGKYVTSYPLVPIKSLCIETPYIFTLNQILHIDQHSHQIIARLYMILVHLLK
jgi:hypothetical protein